MSVRRVSKPLTLTSLASMFDSVTGNASYAGLVLFLALTGCGFPFPEEVAIVTAGMLSAHQKLNWAIAFPACLLGVFAGDSLMYVAGYRGRTLAKQIVQWLPRREPPSDLVRLHALIQRRPVYLMLLAHLTIGLRPLAYFAIGAHQMRGVTFVISEAVCASIVTTVCFVPAYFVGDVVLTWFHNVGLGVTGFLAAVLIVGIVAYFFSRTARRRRLKQVPLGHNEKSHPDSASE